MNDKPAPGQAAYAPGFFSEFTAPSKGEWLAAAKASLKGAPWEKQVFTPTHEGITLQPVYGPDDLEGAAHLDSAPGFAPFARGASATGYLEKPWLICQELDFADPAEFNRAASQGLERGLSALGLEMAAPGGGCGLSLDSLAALETALDGVDISRVPLVASCGPASAPLLALLAALCQKRGLDPAKLSGCAGGDPLGMLAKRGELPRPLEAMHACQASAVGWAAANAPKLRVVLVDSSPYHNAGGSAVQELAFALATGVEYLRQLSARGIAIEQAAGGMGFAFSVGPRFFMEVAKLRAARILWCQAVEAFGGGEEAQAMWIHARTCQFSQTRFDPHVNLLRSTTQAFAAVMGQVQSLSVGPFDQPLGSAGEQSHRLARNLQIILQRECHFTIPLDPAGGSWLVESLTDQLARKAWKLFQEVEALGGMQKALEAGLPQERCAQVADQRAKNLAKRKEVLVGTNMFANPREPAPVMAPPPKRPAPAKGSATDLSHLTPGMPELVPELARAFGEGAALAEAAPALGLGKGALPRARPLAIKRAAADYEALRLAVADNPPTVCLACLGPVSKYKPRADFAAGFFAPAGIAVFDPGPSADVQTAAKAALANRAEVVVICSGDELYPELVPPLCEAIKGEAPGVTVLLAGRPAPEHQAAFQAAGLDGAVYVGADCLAILSSLIPAGEAAS